MSIRNDKFDFQPISLNKVREWWKTSEYNDIKFPDRNHYTSCFTAGALVFSDIAYVYLTINEFKNIFAYDILYDFKDINGKRVLPFTKQQPLFAQKIPLARNLDYLKSIGLDFSNVKSYIGGMFTTNRMFDSISSYIVYNFPEYILIHNDGGLIVKPNKRYLTIPKNTKKINNIKTRLNILEKLLDDFTITTGT